MIIRKVNEQLKKISKRLQPNTVEPDDNNPHWLLAMYQHILKKGYNLEIFDCLSEQFEITQRLILDTAELIEKEAAVSDALQQDPQELTQLRIRLYQLEAQYILSHTDHLIKRCQCFLDLGQNDDFIRTLNSVQWHLDTFLRMQHAIPLTVNESNFGRDFDLLVRQSKQLEIKYHASKTMATVPLPTRTTDTPYSAAYNSLIFFTDPNVIEDQVSRQFQNLRPDF